jgi:hypothetical protein
MPATVGPLWRILATFRSGSQVRHSAADCVEPSGRYQGPLCVVFVTAVRSAAPMSPVGVIGKRPVVDDKSEQRKTQSGIAYLVCGQQAPQRILSIGFPIQNSPLRDLGSR